MNGFLIATKYYNARKQGCKRKGVEGFPIYGQIKCVS